MPKRRNVRTYLRLLIYCFFIYFNNNYIYPLKTDSIEIAIPNTVFHVNSFFCIELKINDNSDIKEPLFEKNIKFVIENECLEFIQTDFSNIYQGILIKNTYKLKQHGFFLLQPVILYENETILLNPVKIKIEPPLLSENTEFKWLIFNETHEPIKNITIGNTYIIALTGFFYKGNSDNRNNVKNIDIIYQAPENAILESAEISENKFKNKIEAGWHCVKFFYWIPLKHGYQLLPQPIINLNKEDALNKKTISIMPEKVFVEQSARRFLKSKHNEKIKQNISPPVEPSRTTTENTFANYSKQKKLREEFEYKKVTAKKIAELRTAESKTFHPFKIKLERKNLEKNIGILSSFSAPPLLIKYSLYIFFIILIIFLIIMHKIIKRKKIISVFIFISLTLFFICILYFNFIAIKQAQLKVFIPEDINSNFAIYHIPETTGIFAGELEIGETVLILYETHGWAKIKKSNGTIGWKQIWY